MRRTLLAALCLLAAGCADLEIKPGSKPMARREIPPGAGLLTGPSGEFVILRMEEKQPGGPPKYAPSAQPSEGEAVQ